MSSSKIPSKVRAAEGNVVLLAGKYNAEGTSTATLLTGGKGITSVDQTGTGLYLITLDKQWGEHLGTYVTLGAATPANIAGHTVALDTYVSAATGDTQPFSVYNAADALHDLVDTEQINVLVVVRRWSN